MIIIRSVVELQNFLQEHKKNNKTIGFVPTLGALHDGHISLITKAMEGNDIVVASIFVNPTQFDEKSDFENYPSTIEEDQKLLADRGCDVLFLPTVEEIYPHGTQLDNNYDLGQLEHILEGRTRPGHYQGVVQVVDRLLEIVKPNDLYLGQKDYQQVLIIQKLINLKNLPVSITICPIIREPDGLAMSSRNRRLSPQERKVANELYLTLEKCKKNYKDFSVAQLKNWAEVNLNVNPLITVDYIYFGDSTNLNEVHNWGDSEHIILLGAIFLGPIRLIDNLFIC